MSHSGTAAGRAGPPRRVLLVAYHYPPVASSSGVQRTLKFSRYLREFGWQPYVLTVSPRAYATTNPEQLAEVPADVLVRRCAALDVARHLQVRGKYPGFLAFPDRWGSWVFSGVPAGLNLIRKHDIQIVWSTYPVPTAQLLGCWLSRLSGKPWVMDVRDPMFEEEFVTDPKMRRFFRWIESQAKERAALATFASPGMRDLYAARYPDWQGDRLITLENGYDEENFKNLPAVEPRTDRSRITLLHSGTIYPDARDPRAFFAALGKLAARGAMTAANTRIVLRATGHDDFVRGHIREQRLEGIVELAPSVPYSEALREMVSVDGLILMQAANSNYQTPAKLYEYLRAGRPILALTDPRGDTAATLRAVDLGEVYALNDAAAVERGLTEFISAVRAGTARGCALDAAQQFSRRSQTQRLAGLLDRVWSEQQARSSAS
jgi:hypothetical protein